jgi:uncharacterized protein
MQNFVWSSGWRRECEYRLIASAHASGIMACLSALSSKALTAEDLCVACGMCCNGVIFADVQIQSGDVPRKLKALGLRLTRAEREGKAVSEAACGSAAGPLKFCQPCLAFDGSRCRIYTDRPVYCREFECLLIGKLREGRTSGTDALREVRKAKTHVERILTLLRQLGDTDEHLPLARRFARTRERLETVGIESPLADLYGQLTVAVLDLNYLLSGVFYPG